MARAAAKQAHTDDVKIIQKPSITIVPRGQEPGVPLPPIEREPEIVEATEDVLRDRDYADKLEFMEQPVSIRIEPSAEKNASNVIPIWVNGKGCEVHIDKATGESIHPEDGSGIWLEFTWIPVDKELTVKRKYIEVLLRAKTNIVHTRIIERPNEDPENKIDRFTSPMCSFSILYDPDPRGVQWMREIRGRNS